MLCMLYYSYTIDEKLCYSCKPYYFLIDIQWHVNNINTLTQRSMVHCYQHHCNFQNNVYPNKITDFIDFMNIWVCGKDLVLDKPVTFPLHWPCSFSVKFKIYILDKEEIV